MGHNKAGVNRKRRLKRSAKNLQTRVRFRARNDWLYNSIDRIWAKEIMINGQLKWMFCGQEIVDGKCIELPCSMSSEQAVGYATDLLQNKTNL